MRVIPSRRVYLAIAIGTGLFLVLLLWSSDRSGAWLLTVLGLALGWDALWLLLALIDGWRPGDRVQVTRQLAERLSIGRENPVQLQVHLPDSAKLPVRLQLCDHLPPQFSPNPDRLAVQTQADETVSYRVFPKQRGEYHWGNIQVRQLGRWGLGWQDWQIPQAQPIAVYPDLIGLRSLSIRLGLQASGTIRQAKRLGMGTEFTELREYSTGDDPRLIDWKATARRSRLLLRVLEPEQEQTLIILLDRGRLMTAQINGIARFDWGLNATLSLALAGLNRGDRVGVGLFDRQLVSWTPPQRGEAHLKLLIDRLTPIQPVLLESDYLGAISAITSQQSRRALVVLLTDVIDQTASSELLLAMGRLMPRYLPFCVTLRDPQIDRQAEQQSDQVSEAYRQAVAIDLLNQRRVALASLQQKGVLVLDAPADQITDRLVDRYLQVKQRGQI